MRKARSIVVLAGLAVCLAACNSAQRTARSLPTARSDVPAHPHPATVPALRYRVWVTEGVMAATHGAGHWIEELWFPEWRVVANADPDSYSEPARLNAFFRERPRNRADRGWVFIPKGVDPETVGQRGPMEEVQVPWDVAQQIRSAALLRSRYEARARSIGSKLKAAGLLREIAPAQ